MTLISDRFHFLHIPKTAGTTLYRILERNLPQNHSPNPIEYGHTPFEADRYEPSGAHCITLLREPVDRIVSHYFYVKQSGPSHYLYETVEQNDWSLVEYAQSGISPELDNGQVRFLTNTESSVPIGGITRQHYEQACSNLKNHFSVVGTVDRFDEFLLLLRRHLGFQKITYQRANVTRKRIAKRDMPESARQAILDCNRWDQKLYEFAQQLMATQLEEYGPALSHDLRMFQIAQWQTRQLERVKWPVSRIVLPVSRMLLQGYRKFSLVWETRRQNVQTHLTNVAESLSGEIQCYQDQLS